jgi:hypothetical protein
MMSLMSLIKETAKAKGLMKPLLLRVFNKSFIDKHDIASGTLSTSLFEFDEDNEMSAGTDLLLRKAVNTARTGVPSDKFGLSLLELLQLDYATFEFIDDVCGEILKDKSYHATNLLKEMEKDK